jgi:hypothetical protein
MCSAHSRWWAAYDRCLFAAVDRCRSSLLYPLSRSFGKITVLVFVYSETPYIFRVNSAGPPLQVPPEFARERRLDLNWGRTRTERCVVECRCRGRRRPPWFCHVDLDGASLGRAGHPSFPSNRFLALARARDLRLRIRPSTLTFRYQ